MYSGYDFYDDVFEPLTPPPKHPRPEILGDTPPDPTYFLATVQVRIWPCLGVAKGCLVGPRGPEIILGSVYNSLPPLLYISTFLAEVGRDPYSTVQ